MSHLSIGVIFEGIVKERNVDLPVDTQDLAIWRDQRGTVEVEIRLCLFIDGGNNIDTMLFGDLSHSGGGGPGYLLRQVEEAIVKLAGEIACGEELLKAYELGLATVNGRLYQLFRLADVLFLGFFTGELNSGDSHQPD